MNASWNLDKFVAYHVYPLLSPLPPQFTCAVSYRIVIFYVHYYISEWFDRHTGLQEWNNLMY